MQECPMLSFKTFSEVRPQPELLPYLPSSSEAEKNDCAPQISAEKKVIYISDFELDLAQWRKQYEIVADSRRCLQLSQEEGTENKSDEHNLEVTQSDGGKTSLDMRGGSTPVEVGEAAQDISSLPTILHAPPVDISTEIEKIKPAIRALESRINNKKRIQSTKVFSVLKRKASSHRVTFLGTKISRPKYFFNTHIISPLLTVTEKAVEQPEYIHGVQHLNSRLEDLQINDGEEPDFSARRKSSKSLGVKRNFIEMKREKVSPESLFTVSMLQALFTYYDLESINLSNPKIIVIKQFAANIFEVHPSQLEKLSTQVRGGDWWMSGRLSVRIIRPSEYFFNTLHLVCCVIGIYNFDTVSQGVFSESAKKALGENYVPALDGPIKYFYQLIRDELVAKGRHRLPHAVALEFVKSALLHHWYSGVVEKSLGFRKAKSDSQLIHN